MMPLCAISSCKLRWKCRKDNSIIFHRFPRNKELAKKWHILCRSKTSISLESAVICSRHFKPEDYVRDLRSELLGGKPKRILKPCAIPSENLVSQSDTKIACLCNSQSLICDVQNMTLFTHQKTSEVCTCGANRNSQNPKTVQNDSDFPNLISEVICKKEDHIPCSSGSLDSKGRLKEISVEQNHTNVTSSAVNISECNNYTNVIAETTCANVNSITNISSECSNFNDHLPNEETLRSGLVAEKPQNKDLCPCDSEGKCCVRRIECSILKKLNLFESRDKWHSDRYKALEAKMCQLKKKLQEYPKVKARNQKLEEEKSEMLGRLATVFSKSQIDFLMKSSSHGRWSDEDMYQAIILKTMSKKAYLFLRSQGFPFPPVSCIKNWTCSRTFLNGKSIKDLMFMFPSREKNPPNLFMSKIKKDSGNLVSNHTKKTTAKVLKTCKSNGVKNIKMAGVESDTTKLSSWSNSSIGSLILSTSQSASLNYLNCSSLSLLSEHEELMRFSPDLVEMKFEEDSVPYINTVPESSNTMINLSVNNQPAPPEFEEEETIAPFTNTVPELSNSSVNNQSAPPELVEMKFEGAETIVSFTDTVPELSNSSISNQSVPPELVEMKFEEAETIVSFTDTVPESSNTMINLSVNNQPVPPELVEMKFEEGETISPFTNTVPESSNSTMNSSVNNQSVPPELVEMKFEECETIVSPTNRLYSDRVIKDFSKFW